MAASWIRGDTNSFSVTVTDGGAAVALAGATIEAALASSVGVTPILLKHTADFTIVDNVATCQLAVADTATIPPGTYYIEVEITDAGGKVQTAQEIVSIGGDTI